MLNENIIKNPWTLKVQGFFITELIMASLFSFYPLVRAVLFSTLVSTIQYIREYLGVVEAVKYIIAHDYTPRIVYADSSYL